MKMLKKKVDDYDQINSKDEVDGKDVLKISTQGNGRKN